MDKLIAYDNDFYVLGHRILHIPWFFLSLKQHQSPIVPVVGQDEEEGYFARFLYQYVLSPTQIGGIRLDLTQKLGAGLGIDHFYTFPRDYGELFLYGRQDLRETVVRLDNTVQLPNDVIFALTADIRKDSEFTLQPTTATTINANIHRNGTNNSELFNYTDTLSESNFQSDNKSANLRYNLNGKWGSLQYSSEYSSFGYSATTGTTTNPPPDQTLWNRLQVLDHLGFADLNLRVDQHMNLGGELNTPTTLIGEQRLPEIYLDTSPSQLKCNYFNFMPTRFTIGWGLYREFATGASLARYLFNWQSNTKKPITWGRTQIFPTFTFRQTMYGDEFHTAYYYWSGNINAQTKLGPFSNVLTYGRQDAHGFTPLSFDTIYPYETVSESLQYYTDPLRMYLTGGRDLLHGQWQDINLRADAQLAPGVAMHQSIGYDIENSQWLDAVSQYNFLRTNRFIFNLGTRYNFTGTGLSTASTEMDWVVSSRWHIQWIGGYDGVSRQLTANEFLFIRDLHCWDAALLYSRQNHITYLYIRLKALNLPLPFFGIGRGGQVLDTNVGTPN